MNYVKALHTYYNGNRADAKQWLRESKMTLGEFLDAFIQSYKPDMEEIVRFVKCLDLYEEESDPHSGLDALIYTLRQAVKEASECPIVILDLRGTPHEWEKDPSRTPFGYCPDGSQHIAYRFAAENIITVIPQNLS